MAIIDSIQRGVVTLDSDGTDTNVTISAVDLSRSWVVCTVRTPSDGPAGAALGYNLSTSTNINMRLYDMTTANVIVEWQVIEFSSESGITVQRGSWTTETSVTISAVTVEESHVDLNMFRTGGTWGSDDWAAAKIDSTTSIATSSSNNATKYWQVVDWNGYANVQQIDFSVGSGDTTTKDNTISALSDYTKTMVIGSVSYAGDIYGEDLCILYCTSNTNLRAERQGGNLPLTISAQVIEFVSSEIGVQQSISTITSASTSSTATITSVDTSKTTIVPGSLGWWWGSSTNTDDDAGHFAVSYDLTDSTTVTLQKVDTGQTTKCSFSVIEFDLLATGSGDLSIPVPTLSGVGKLSKQESGDLSIPVLTLSGVGLLSKQGLGDISIPVPTLSGVGKFENKSSGDISIPVPTLSGVGFFTYNVSGDIVIPIPQVSGSAIRNTNVSGTGYLVIPIPVVSGVANNELYFDINQGIIDTQLETKDVIDIWAYDMSKNTLTKGEEINEKAINTSLENILATIRGERIFSPYFGSPLPLIVFETLSIDSAERLLDELLNAITLWEDRITVIENEIEMDILTEENALTLVIPYRININGLIAIFSKKVVI